MKDYFRKGLSGLVLGTYLATGGYVKASEGAPDRIDMNHVDSIEVLFEQPEYFQVGRKTLDCGKTYLIDQDSHIDKPETALNSIMQYFSKIEDNYKNVEGRRKIDEARSKTLDLLMEEAGGYKPLERVRVIGRQLTDAGLAKIKEAASDGVITPAEYEELGNGDVYVTQRVGSKIEAQGRLDQGIIVRVDHSRDNCYEPRIAARKLPQAPSIEETYPQPTVQYQPVPQPTPQPQPLDLEEAVKGYQPGEETKGIVEEEIKENGKKKRSAAMKALVIGGSLVAAELILQALSKKKTKGEPHRITGGDEY